MLDEAISWFKRALIINPNLTEAHNNVGLAYYNKGKLDEAIAEDKKALTINPNFAEVHYNLSLAFYYKGNYKLSVIHCDKSIELSGSVHTKLLELLKP